MMATELKKMTFVVTPNMEELMDEAKKIFYDRTLSEMIRTLITAGLTALKSEKGTVQKRKCCRQPQTWKSQILHHAMVALLFPNKEIVQAALAQIMYSLKNVGTPIGVSAYQVTNNLSENLERQYHRWKIFRSGSSA